MTRNELVCEWYWWVSQSLERWPNAIENAEAYAKRLADLEGDCEHDRLNDHGGACLDCQRTWIDGKWQ